MVICEPVQPEEGLQPCRVTEIRWYPARIPKLVINPTTHEQPNAGFLGRGVVVKI